MTRRFIVDSRLALRLSDCDATHNPTGTACEMGCSPQNDEVSELPPCPARNYVKPLGAPATGTP